jgi:hypothetical protein
MCPGPAKGKGNPVGSGSAGRPPDRAGGSGGQAGRAEQIGQYKRAYVINFGSGGMT